MARDHTVILEETEEEKKRKKRQTDLDKIFYDTMTIESDNQASQKNQGQ